MADDHWEIKLFFITLIALFSVGAVGQQGAVTASMITELFIKDLASIIIESVNWCMIGAVNERICNLTGQQIISAYQPFFYNRGIPNAMDNIYCMIH